MLYIHYLQTQGTAVGTHMAHSYANLFMEKLEKEILSTHHPVPLVWLRYIDEVFAVRTHGGTLLQSFSDHLKPSHSLQIGPAQQCPSWTQGSPTAVSEG